jgi:hypothetical protein
VYELSDKLCIDEAFEIVNEHKLHLLAETRGSEKATDYAVVYISKSYVHLIDTKEADNDGAYIVIRHEEFDARYSNGLRFKPYIRSPR